MVKAGSAGAIGRFFAVLIALSATAFGSLPPTIPPIEATSVGPAPNYANHPAARPKVSALSAKFTVNYNPSGGCVTTGLKNFIPPDTPSSAWPQEAKDAFTHALNIWAMLLNINQPIVINACWQNLGASGPLGVGQPVSAVDFTNAPLAGKLYPVALANQLALSDLNNSDSVDHDGDNSDADAEIIIAFNNNGAVNWYFGTDGNPPAGKTDFVTTALHEVAHGLGFAATLLANTGGVDICDTGNGNDGQGCWGMGTGQPAIYDYFVENSAGESLINIALFGNPSVDLKTQLTGGNIYFNGPLAKAANGGNRPKLFAPNPFQIGGSIVHLDSGTPAPNQLMTPYAGGARHHPGPVALAMLKDMGWSAVDLPPVTLVKSASAGAVVAGQVVTYTLTVTNTDYLSATNLLLTDTVPAHTTLNPASLSGDAALSGVTPGSVITWTTGVTLSTGNALSRTLAVTVNLNLNGVSAITNTAFVTSTAGVGASAAVVIQAGSGAKVYLPIMLKDN